MMIAPYYFKLRAKQALKGSWQTALVVSFFSTILITVSNMLNTLWVPDPMLYAGVGQYEQYMVKVMNVPKSHWVILAVVSVLAAVLTPAMVTSCNHYFVALIRGNDLSVKEGLMGRAKIWLKALGLFALMSIRIALWSLLFVIPGIMAALRYSMAPFYMAEHPEMKITEAINKSKETMKDKKMNYFALSISFIGWSLLASLAQTLLMGISLVAALVAAQFMQLAIATYMNAACSAFYHTFTSEKGLEEASVIMRAQMRKMGMSDSDIDRAGFGGSMPGSAFEKDDQPIEIVEEDDKPDNDSPKDASDAPEEQPDDSPKDQWHL